MRNETMAKKKKKYSQWKFLIAFTVMVGLFAGVRHVFGIEVPLHVEKSATTELMAHAENSGKEDETADMEEVLAMEQPFSANPVTEEGLDEEVEEIEEEEMEETKDEVDEEGTMNKESNDSLSDSEMTDSMPRGKHRIRGVWSYSDCFPDIQDVQIVAAQKHGISPVRNRAEAEVLVRQHQLVNISHSPFYSIDKLTHSIPYLVPRAQHLLNTICLNFIDSCQVKGLPLHMPIVTSVLRTTDDVSNLQRGNKNATTNSCHCYGTTVDIAYNKFMPITGTYESNAALLRWNEPMKQVLSEVLNDLRRQGKCYVKYERKQGCFHLTCR